MRSAPAQWHQRVLANRRANETGELAQAGIGQVSHHHFPCAIAQPISHNQQMTFKWLLINVIIRPRTHRTLR